MTEDKTASWSQDFETVEQHIAFNAQLPTGDGSVRCLVCGEELQYITHSHVASHAAGSPRTVDDYREKVADTLDVEEEDVPVVSSELHDRLADETREAWESGRYDHIRKGDV